MNVIQNYQLNLFNLRSHKQTLQANPNFGNRKQIIIEGTKKVVPLAVISTETLAAIVGVKMLNSQKYSKFNVDKFIADFSESYNSMVGINSYKQKFLDIPSTKKMTEILVERLISTEKQGVKIQQKDILKLLKELKENGFNIDYKKSKSKIEDICHMDTFYSSMFEDLYKISKNTPMDPTENVATYMSKIIELRDLLVQEKELKKINKIKSKLKYEKDKINLSPEPLLQEDKVQIIKEIQHARESENLEDVIPKLTASSTDQEIFEAWKEFHMCSCHLSSGYLQRQISRFGDRYNSFYPPKTKASYDIIKAKNYKSEYKYEPVYSWLDDLALKNLPKESEIYRLKREQCCSTHKHYAERDCGDHMGLINYVKFIIHPKSETSRAISLGYHQEVTYPEGEEFRIISKECVEYIDPETGGVCPRWEIHMQEI